MVPKVSTFAAELADREAIRDCLYRYCRGIDRSDPELVRSAYWPGAMDYHTGFTGTVEDFIAWAMPRLAAMEQAMHMVGNILIRIDGAVASVESYLWSVSVLPGETPQQVQAAGRYADRFEKRDDEWRIAERVVVHDWFNQNGDVGNWDLGPFGMPGLLRGQGDRRDSSYRLKNMP